MEQRSIFFFFIAHLVIVFNLHGHKAAVRQWVERLRNHDEGPIKHQEWRSGPCCTIVKLTILKIDWRP